MPTEQAYQQKGRLVLTELGGKTYVATEPNFPVLQGFVERGEDARIVPGKDRDTGEPWYWVNPPGDRPAPSAGQRPSGESLTAKVEALSAKVDEVLSILKQAEVSKG